jgi:RNA polymerase sigma-70 factor (ECF subfamily)
VPREAGVALALRTVAGFGVGEIARAFLVGEAAVAQRLVRAKRRLREADVRLAVPESAADLAARLPAVLDTLYLVFNEGYSASEGDAPIRRDLCAEALRLARLVARHPTTAGPEPHALAALLCFHGARLDARVDAGGDLVLLADQDRGRWDRGLVAQGFRHLARAAAGDAVSRYHHEAEIASYHAAAATPEATNWAGVLGAYDALLAATASPVVAVHRAVAVGMMRGAAAALDALAAVAGDPALARYLWLYGTRAHWRARAGDAAGAAADYRAALAVPATESVRAFLRARLAELPGPAPGS